MYQGTGIYKEIVDNLYAKTWGGEPLSNAFHVDRIIELVTNAEKYVESIKRLNMQLRMESRSHSNSNQDNFATCPMRSLLLMLQSLEKDEARLAK